MSLTEFPCICIFSALYPPSMGGVETFTLHLANALAKRGLRVIVVTLNTHASEDKVTDEGVEVVRLPCRGFLNNRYPLMQKNKTYQHLWAWLLSQHIDYVLVNTRFYPHSYTGLSFARKKDVSPILIEHGSAHLTMGNPVVDAGVQLVEHIITKAERRFRASYYAVSRKASAWLLHFDINSCGELPNAIDADAYATSASSRNYRVELGLSSSTFIVAFVGRLVNEKGVLELAQAVKTWGSEENITVLAAGDGPQRETLRAYENNRFRLLGKLGREDVAALLSQANVICLPSRSEGFATSLLEAAACQTPAITTSVGGADELVPSSEYGTILTDHRPETIRRVLQNTIRNPDRIEEQGHNVNTLVRSTYSWDKTARLVIEACQKAQE